MCVLQELFPEHLAPFTLHEITDRLECVDPAINYQRVYRAYAFLRSDPSLALIVVHLEARPNSRQLRFSGQAAARIARQALSRSTKKLFDQRLV